ncbi:MAG: hypothetical protein GXP03_00155, partial [Alphaproteobacteria bacterium]|nr:hypothetical protein [Alphaproteobacteria bacterium]
MCQIEINLVLRLLVRMPIADDQIASALEHVRTVSEAGCEAGSSAACEMRAGFYADQGVRFFLITQPLKEGQLAGELALDWARDENEFQIKLSAAVQAEAETLRPECEAGNARACGQLGMLIADRGLVPKRPYEEIGLLVEGCGADDRADFTCDALYMSALTLGSSKKNREQENQIKADAMQNLADQCSAGKGSVCNVLARLDEDRSKRKTWTALACQAGEPRACSDLGQSLYIKYKIKKSEADLDEAVLNLNR